MIHDGLVARHVGFRAHSKYQAYRGSGRAAPMILLDNFRSGEKDVKEFWLELQDKLVHIKCIAIRDRNGDYRGTLEVTQDATHIRQLEGEKRLLSE